MLEKEKKQNTPEKKSITNENDDERMWTTKETEVLQCTYAHICAVAVQTYSVSFAELRLLPCTVPYFRLPLCVCVRVCVSNKLI